MNAHHDLERRLTDYYESEPPQRAPDRVLDAALASLDTTRQRRVLIAAPRRFHRMNSFARLAIAAAAVIVVGVGLAVAGPFRSSGTGPGGVATPSPSPSAVPSASPSASALPSIGVASSASPSASPLAPLTGSFTSAVYGFSTSYPAGWKVQPATQQWTTGVPWSCVMTCTDVIYEKESDSPFFSVASQGRDAAGGQWMSSVLADPGWEGTCPAVTQPVDIDGTAGTLATTCPEGLLFAVTTTRESRGYVFILYRIDDIQQFKDFLATVRLHPADAKNTLPTAPPPGSASPSAS